MAISGKNIVGEEAATPSSYKVASIQITNHDNTQTVDIQNIIVEMQFSESLYSNTLYFSFGIKESSAFFETFPIIGQETVRVRIEFFEFEGAKREMDLTFLTLDIPTFGKTQAQHSQVYRIQCISPEIYSSSFKRISRSFSNTTTGEIEKIYTQDLGLDLNVSGTAVSKSRGIIPWQYPVRAAEWFRSQSYDDKYRPFFLYQTLDGKHNLSSLTHLFDQDIHEEYFDSSDYSQAPLTREDYIERKQRMIEITSDMKMQKVNQSMQGVFASRNGYLDWSTKKYTEHVYNYDSDYDTSTSFQNKKMLSKSFLEGTPSTSPDSHREHISVNSLPFTSARNETESNMAAMGQTGLHYLNAYNGALNTNVHDLKITGDYACNPGKVLQLNFQRAIDPSETDSDELFDEHLSGKYIVISAIHKFKNNEYFTELRVKRDGFEINV